jgi:hypothetical protein
MLSNLQRLHAQIEDGGLITSATFGTRVVPAVLLDARDAPEFEQEWLRVDSALAKLTDGVELPDVAAIRKAAYLKTFEAVREPELAACVSDDFGLIAAALATDYSDPWLTGLWLSYKTGVFPGSKVNPSTERLQTTI